MVSQSRIPQPYQPIRFSICKSRILVVPMNILTEILKQTLTLKQDGVLDPARNRTGFSDIGSLLLEPFSHLTPMVVSFKIINQSLRGL